MLSKSHQGSFIQSVSVTATAIPKPVLWLGIVAGFFSPSLDFAAWLGEHMPLPLIVASTISAILVWNFAEYFIVHRTIDTGNPSLKGWGWFAAGTVALFTPLVLGFGVVYFLYAGIGSAVSAPAFLIVLVFTLAAFALMPAWPVCLMRRGSLVSPLRVFRATNGHRWGLIGMSLVGGGVHKIVPAISSANTFETALLFFMGKGLVNGGFIILTACISTTAWMYAYRNDPALLEM